MKKPLRQAAGFLPVNKSVGECKFNLYPIILEDGGHNYINHYKFLP